ncbi:MAG: hypothetical protein K0R24_644 [Gammaproteobacteria bacterium]|jgi:hypothetical protein|nr:hypothetical protein [Gammaproteobacteria bacterium]
MINIQEQQEILYKKENIDLAALFPRRQEPILKFSYMAEWVAAFAE